MPIPAPTPYRPSNLTKKQQQEQLAAVYGVPMETPQFTAEQFAQMRQMLADYDSKHKGPEVHDLNNPPRQQYRFQKFPAMVYDHSHSHPAREQEQMDRFGNITGSVHIQAKLVTRIVQNQAELDAALAQGWVENAPEFREEEVETPLSASYAAEAERKQGQLNEANRRRKSQG